LTILALHNCWLQSGSHDQIWTVAAAK